MKSTRPVAFTKYALLSALMSVLAATAAGNLAMASQSADQDTQTAQATASAAAKTATAVEMKAVAPEKESTGASAQSERSASEIVEASFEYHRGKASKATVVMTIHRPDWERSQTIRSWTEGNDDSLFFITEPASDRGNGTLKKGHDMWTYNPQINRVIKLPPSMMSQAWMGSDFSNNDLAKSDTILNEYTHEIVGTKERDGVTVYHIKSLPKPEAPVVWGKQELLIREDDIWVEQRFYDEDQELVKTLVFSDIVDIGGKDYPRKMTMSKADAEDEYTLVEYKDLEFVDDLPDRLFTLPSLKNPNLR